MIRNYSFRYPIPFVGRTQELADITARLLNPECRLLTLTGLGGSGKTRLAIEAATTLAPQFSQGAVFVGLQSLTRSDLLVPTIAQALGITFYGEGEPQQRRWKITKRCNCFYPMRVAFSRILTRRANARPLFDFVK